MTYASAQFATGMIGDSIDRRKVLSVSYFLQAILFGLLGFLGMKCYIEGTETVNAASFESRFMYFILIFAGIGLV